MGRTRPLILQLGEFLFVHGSLTDSLIENNIGRDGFVDLDKINKDTSLWLQGKSKVPIYLSEPDENNPVFSRFYSNKRELPIDTCKKIDEHLKMFKNAEHVIMGHSSYKEINTACSGKLIRTDVALSRAFGGTVSSKKLQALEILRGGPKPKINIITESDKISLNY